MSVEYRINVFPFYGKSSNNYENILENIIMKLNSGIDNHT